MTDHALMRFVERASDATLEALRAQIETSLTRAAEAAASIGATDYLIVRDDLTYVVRGSAVVTILTKTSPADRAHALRRGGTG
ncbi:hypothetical protein [Thermomonas sp.]|uniref:hypothetical protein n=1 Tax=Thermomonas sp. TaxID=1971895 RepID=UPI002621D884|nr:hypothetical protein [Thermomonas sp.]